MFATPPFYAELTEIVDFKAQLFSKGIGDVGSLCDQLLRQLNVIPSETLHVL